MDIIRKITELSFQPGSVKEFSEFVDTIHTEIKCTNSECTLGIFNNKLKKATDENISGGESTYFLWKYAFNLSMYFHQCISYFHQCISYLKKVM